jgi:hypothetical protein
VKKSKNLQKAIVSVLALLLIILFVKANIFKNSLSGQLPILDFDNYYAVSNLIKDGVNPYLTGLMASAGPPLVFLYFFPFSFLNITVARFATTFINIGAGFLACYLLAKKFFPKYKALSFLFFSLAFFSAFPTRFSIGMGQPDILVALLIAIVITQESQLLKAFCISAMSVIKTIYLFCTIPFARNRKFIKYFILATALFLAVSFLFLKPAWFPYYFRSIFPNLNNTPLPTSGLDYYNQSLKSTFYRIDLSNLYPFIFWPILAIAALVVFLTQSFELATITTLLLSPISWQHYYVSLFPIFIAAFAKMHKNPKNILLFVMSILLWSVDFPWLHNAQVNLINGILASHFFISGCILYFLMYNASKND